jgi:hypothetical protein
MDPTPTQTLWVPVPRQISAELVDVPLTPVPERPRSGAGDVLDVVGQLAGTAGPEELIEVLNRFRKRRRCSSLNRLRCSLLGSYRNEASGPLRM